MKKIIFSILFLFTSFSFFANTSHSWLKTVLISPIRVVIDKKKTANVKIINTSDTQTTYRIEMVSMEMDGKGLVYESKNPKKHSKQAIQLLKYSPRRVSLKPGDVQTIRIMARKKNDLPEGEYRCHLKVSPLPETTKINKIKKENKNGVNVNINYLVHTSIPIIIRHGNISNIIKTKKIEYSDHKLIVFIERSGKKSGLFDIEALQNNKIIGKRERTAFYFPNKKLEVEVPLNKPFNRNKEIKVRLIDLESENKEILNTFSTII